MLSGPAEGDISAQPIQVDCPSDAVRVYADFVLTRSSPDLNGLSARHTASLIRFCDRFQSSDIEGLIHSHLKTAALSQPWRVFGVGSWLDNEVLVKLGIKRMGTVRSSADNIPDIALNDAEDVALPYLLELIRRRFAKIVVPEMDQRSLADARAGREVKPKLKDTIYQAYQPWPTVADTFCMPKS
jgi:hypothetical protein